MRLKRQLSPSKNRNLASYKEKIDLEHPKTVSLGLRLLKIQSEFRLKGALIPFAAHLGLRAVACCISYSAELC